MSTQEKQKENLLVKLARKSVGLPTGGSSCCGSSAVAASSASTEDVKQVTVKVETTDCGCDKAEATDTAAQTTASGG